MFPIRLPRLLAASTLAASIIVAARPNRYGHSDREERHMFPAVSSGPLDPAWSPDGRWIAFSMRGDIWKVPAEGGDAVALTSGPNYYFEPAWSPDGKRVALSMDVGGNLEIGIVGADGGPVRPVAPSPRVDLQPTWGRDGNTLYFASARNGGWHIFRHDFTTDKDTAVVNGIQPSVSPTGSRSPMRKVACASWISRRCSRGSFAARKPSTAPNPCGRPTDRTSST